MNTVEIPPVGTYNLPPELPYNVAVKLLPPNCWIELGELKALIKVGADGVVPAHGKAGKRGTGSINAYPVGHEQLQSSAEYIAMIPNVPLSMYLLIQEKHPVESFTTTVYQAPNAVPLKSNETDKLSISTFPLEVTVVTPVYVLC